MQFIRNVIRGFIGALIIYISIAFGLIYFPIFPETNPSTFDTKTLTKAKPETLGIEKSIRLRDNTPLVVRHYPSDAACALLFIHGSGTESRYLSHLASFLADNQYAEVYTPDLRGHGKNLGPRGDIEYLGQYDDDLTDLVLQIRKNKQCVLIGGHSSGGGLALRYAGQPNVAQVDGYIFFAPYVHHSAPTVKPNSGGWVTVSIPRIIGIQLLRRFGIKHFDEQKVLIFNRQEFLKNDLQLESYSYRLLMSLSADDYKHAIQSINKPSILFVGSEDESFFADKFESTFASAKVPVDVHVLNGVKHLDVVNSQSAHEKLTKWFSKLR